jgi:flagellin-like protein
MELKRLFTADEENRAVSPVIGVILMVAITVILAAVIGTFVLGLGDQVQQTSPNAQWNWETDGDIESGGSLSITHEGGDPVEATTLSFSGTGLNSGPYTDLVLGDDSDTDLSADANAFPDAEVTAGDTATLSSTDLDATSGDEIRLIWESQGQSSTLTTYEV